MSTGAAAMSVKSNGGSERDGFYKNYRAFYGGATPSTEAPGTKHMAPIFQQQQNRLLKNKLQATAEQILNTKSFAEQCNDMPDSRAMRRMYAGGDSNRSQLPSSS